VKLVIVNGTFVVNGSQASIWFAARVPVPLSRFESPTFVEVVEPVVLIPIIACVKVTVAVCVMVIVSLVSVAMKTSAPAVVDFTLKVACPEPLVVP